MQAHDYKDMPGRSTEIGDNPNETVMMLRCTWCLKTPTKAREDGCPVHELEEAGKILLSYYNPDGVAYFHGRVCITCEEPIMGHWLRKGSSSYWCKEVDGGVCEGVSDCVYDVEGIVVPEEKLCPPQ